MNFIIFTCALSTEGDGVRCIWMIMVAPIRIGMMFSGSVMNPSGMCAIVSAVERSAAQRNGWKRSSAALGSMEKKPMKKGIVRRIGRQPPIGLIRRVLNSSIVACCCFWGLSLYFSRMAWSSGWIFAMRLADLEAANVGQMKMVLSVRVVSTMAQPQAHEFAGSALWIQVISVSRISLKNLKKPKSMILC